ncbi:MAG TPA: protease inhibitor I42 family protein [Mucilaginibacter sp.]|jgi:inhibitor of cysteine peptidase|nr:protease inhibitor I42 family protein [Mucilaginibacter sp.]
MQIITAKQSNNLTVKVAEPFIIELDETPTSGYQWQFEALDDAISLMESKYLLNQESGIGGGGKRTFRLRINKTGEFELKVNLIQPWVGLSSAVKKHSFIIHTKN